MLVTHKDRVYICMFIGVSVRVLYYVIIRKNHIFKKNQKKILRLFKRNLDKRQGGGSWFGGERSCSWRAVDREILVGGRSHAFHGTQPR